MRAFAGAFALLLTTLPALAGPQHILIGMDETSSFGSGGQSYRAPGNDTLMDASDPAHPKLGAPGHPASIRGPAF